MWRRGNHRFFLDQALLEKFEKQGAALFFSALGASRQIKEGEKEREIESWGRKVYRFLMGLPSKKKSCSLTSKRENLFKVEMVFFQFLIVFFANHVLPGIYVIDQTKLPHVGGDLLFAFILGVINSIICPFIQMVKKTTFSKLFCVCFVLNFRKCCF